MGVCRRALLSVFFPFALAACDSGAIKEQQHRLEQLESQLEVTRAVAHVTVEGFEYRFEDQFFQPDLVGSMALSVDFPSTNQLPERFYLHLGYDVAFEGSEVSLSDDEVVVLVEHGRAKLDYRLSLPSHELSQHEASVTIKPKAWTLAAPAITASQLAFEEEAQ